MAAYVQQIRDDLTQCAGGRGTVTGELRESHEQIGSTRAPKVADDVAASLAGIHQL